MREKQFIEFFIQQFEDRRYGDEKIDFIIEPRYKGYSPDLIIKAGKRNLAAIEFKGKHSLDNAVSNFSNEHFFKFQTRYFVFTDGDKYFLFDRFVHPKEPFEFPLDRVVKRISTRMSQKRLTTIKSS